METENIASALFGKSRTSVLAILFCHSDRAFYTRQIVRAAGAGHGAVQRELSALVKAGLAISYRQGNQTYFQANKESPVFEELKGLMIKTAGVADVLKGALAPLADRITAAFIYGSFAKGSETGESDVDVMIIGDVLMRDAVSAFRAAQGDLRREVNPSIYSAAEFRNRIAHSDHFITTILKEPKILLIGDEDDLVQVG